jgi:hypothetical protein
MLEHTIIEQNATAICASWFDDLSIDQTTEGRDQPLSLGAIVKGEMKTDMSLQEDRGRI